MTLSEIFCDPLDPARSIQLNNKYWPGARFELLRVIADADGLLEDKAVGGAARCLQALRRYFPGEKYFAKFLARIHKLQAFRSTFGYRTGRIDIADDVIEANLYTGTDTRASYPMLRAASLLRIAEETADLYKREYGTDILRTNCTVRFATRDGRRADVTDHGRLSDYHNDERKGITTVIYFSDVRDEDGAFSFIPGSELIPRSLVLTAIHHVVAFDLEYTSPEQLACLPLEFRGSAGIGNFLDHEKVEVLYDRRQVLEGGIGTFVTFNGQYLLHRGGKPVSGSRTAGFIQPEGLLRHKLGTVRSACFAAIHA